MRCHWHFAVNIESGSKREKVGSDLGLGVVTPPPLPSTLFSSKWNDWPHVHVTIVQPKLISIQCA